MNEKTDPAMDQWQECGPGELVAHAHRIKRNHRNRRAVLMGGAAVVLLVSFPLIWPTNQPPPSGDRNDGGILCSELRRQLPGYRDGTLSEATRIQIDEHLKTCPFCGRYVKKSPPQPHPTFAQSESTAVSSGTDPSGASASEMPPREI